jgi:hypothetical protein
MELFKRRGGPRTLSSSADVTGAVVDDDDDYEIFSIL